MLLVFLAIQATCTSSVACIFFTTASTSKDRSHFKLEPLSLELLFFALFTKSIACPSAALPAAYSP